MGADRNPVACGIFNPDIDEPDVICTVFTTEDLNVRFSLTEARHLNLAQGDVFRFVLDSDHRLFLVIIVRVTEDGEVMNDDVPICRDDECPRF